MSEYLNSKQNKSLGHPISYEVKRYDEIFAPSLKPCGDHLEDRSVLERLYRQELSCLVIKEVFTSVELEPVVAGLSSHLRSWGTPNQGMKGGEIRTIGAAATPTFTSFTGPEVNAYLESSQKVSLLTAELFEGLNPLERCQDLFSELADGALARPPQYELNEEVLGQWLPFNYRALDEGEQIYSHHDQHYKLPIYQGFPTFLDQHTALSWFITLQRPQAGGELVLYGLWGSDPNPPILPTRFLDTLVLEQQYRKEKISLENGDLVIFDSGHFVHRVTPIEGPNPRLTMGGFMTFSKDRQKLAFWS